MLRIRLPFIATVCLTLLLCSEQLAFALLVPISSIDRIWASFASEIPESVRKQVETALKSKDCNFIDGNWFNGRISLRFAGDTSAVNEMLQQLASCPTVTLNVSFKALKDDCDWMIVNDMRRSHSKFDLIVNLKSKNIRLEDLLIPSLQGPDLQPQP